MFISQKRLAQWQDWSRHRGSEGPEGVRDRQRSLGAGTEVQGQQRGSLAGTGFQGKTGTAGAGSSAKEAHMRLEPAVLLSPPSLVFFCFVLF